MTLPKSLNLSGLRRLKAKSTSRLYEDTSNRRLGVGVEEQLGDGWVLVSVLFLPPCVTLSQVLLTEDLSFSLCKMEGFCNHELLRSLPVLPF